MKRFKGFLRTGSKVTPGRVFDLEGHTYDASGGNPMASPGSLMGGMLGVGGEGGGGGTFLDLQVVLQLTGPGREQVKQSRTLMRAADITKPSFAPPLVEWSILVQPQWISQQLAGHQLLRLVFALGKAAIDARSPGRQARSVEPPPAIPEQLLRLALLRRRATAGLLATQGNIHALVDEPMVTIAGHRLTALYPEVGRITGQRTIDIVANPVRYVGREAATQAVAFDVAVRQGVADCTLEQSLLQEAYPQAAAGSGFAIFDRAKAEGRAPVVAKPEEEAKLRRAGMSDADVEWIRANERPQATLIASATADGAAAWWSVGPDGAALLRVSGGGGQAQTEHEFDVMLVSLKLMFSMLCAFETHEAFKTPESQMSQFTVGFCIAATMTSAGMFALGIHAVSWVLIGVEVVVVVGSKALGGE